MVSCPKCNAQNEPGAVYCDQCGAYLIETLVAVGGGAAEAALPPSGSTCPACGAMAIPGDAFCNECGAALDGAVQVQPVQAQPAPVQAGPAAPVQAGAVTPVAVTPVAARAVQAQIVAADGQRVVLAGRAAYLIGREDPVSGIYPEVDTTLSGGDTAGVSRRHAEIVVQSDQWFVQDLNSTNGTFVNNQRLAPQTRHPLTAGDQLRLGKWVATFQVN